MSYASSLHGVSIQLDSQVSWDGTSMDFFNSIENARGSSFDDYLLGSSGDNVLSGGGGNDTIDGGAGNDTIVLSGLLSDYVFTQLGADTYQVTDLVAGRDGVDTFTSIELVLFGDGTTHAPPDLIV